jgi:ParB family chromosome partitioning protein
MVNIIERILPIEQLKPSAFQPRENFESVALQALADSLREEGMLQPLVVRPTAQGKYEIIAGERRWRAAQMAGLKEVPCRVGEFSDERALKIALIENMLRQDLNPVELAQGIERMAGEFKFTHEEIAAVLGKSRSEISNQLRLLKLDTRVRTLLATGDLSESHGKLLAGVGQADQYLLAREVIAKGWSTRALEESIKNNALRKSDIKPTLPEKSTDVKRLEQQVTDHMGYAVNIQMKTRQKGMMKIHFGNLEELDGILGRLGYSHDR